MNFKNKNVVITGASSGIGEATAIEFAKKGANVILIARSKNKLDTVEQQLSKFDVKTLTCLCDVSNKIQVNQTCEYILKNFSSIDVLVNNAGFGILRKVSELSIEEIESQMATNYFGMVYFTKNLLPIMLKQNSGHIVNVASVAASFGLPGIAAYCASKFAMLGFSEGLKSELQGTKVKVTVVSPIMVRTNFFDHESFEKVPKKPTTSLSPKTVAKAVIKAANSSRLEIVVPPVVRGAIWAKHTFPYLINPVVSSSFKKYMKSEKEN